VQSISRNAQWYRTLLARNSTPYGERSARVLGTSGLIGRGHIEKSFSMAGTEVTGCICFLYSVSQFIFVTVPSGHLGLGFGTLEDIKCGLHLAHGSMIRNIVDVERTVLTFISGRTLTIHYQITNPSLQIFRRTKVFSIHHFLYPITFLSKHPSSRPHPNKADDLLNMSVYHT
jgi:hypothetical protein